MTTPQQPAWPSIWSQLATTAFQQDWIDAGGIRTRYCQAGPADAPAVLMMHGVGASWECFCANIAAFGEHFNVIAFDAVGCGFSDKPTSNYELPIYTKHVAALMDAFGLASASLVGVSMGGIIASRFAIEHPARVDKLVFVSTLAGLRTETSDPVLADQLEALVQERMKAVADPTWENVAPVLDTLIHDPDKRIPDLVAVRQMVYSQPNIAPLIERIMRFQDTAVYNRNALSDGEWQRIAKPALVVTSENDQSFYRQAAATILGNLPDVRHIELQGVGHWPQFEAPEIFNAQVIAFLRGDSQ